MNRVLVTGADGFIGRCCLEPLRRAGFAVEAVSRRAHAPEPGVGWRHCDLLEPGAARRLIDETAPTHLLHLAWFAKPGAWMQARENFAWVSASLDLVTAFAEAGGRRAVLAGSCSEYDWRYGWCDEAVTPLAPATVYGTCKNALRALTAALAAQSGFSCAWARIFFLYGPGEHPDRLVSSLARALLRGEPAACTSGEQMRDFLHVADVASALVAVLRTEAGGAINIASGAPVAVRDIVGRIAEQTGRAELVRLGALPSRPGDPPLVAGDPRRLRDEVGWRPAFDLDSGLADAVGWWRGQLASAGAAPVLAS